MHKWDNQIENTRQDGCPICELEKSSYIKATSLIVHFWKKNECTLQNLRRFRLWGVLGRYHTEVGSVHQISFAVCSMICLLQALFPLSSELTVASSACSDHYCSSVYFQKNVSVLHWCRFRLHFFHFVCTFFQRYSVLSVPAGSSLRCKHGPIPRTPACTSVATCQLLTTELWALCSRDGLTKVYWRCSH